MMRLLISVTLILTLAACSAGADAPTPLPSPTETRTPPPTSTPAPPTQTFTATPTLLGGVPPTATATEEVTVTPFISVTPLSQITPFTPTPAVQMDGFISILPSVTSFYKGSQCQPSKVKFTVQVEDSVNVKYVLLFARFKSLRAERASKWSTFPMDTLGAGTFLYELSSDQMLEDQYFQTSWLEYQLVATTESGREIGRTGIFKERITMLACVPTPPSTPPTVKP